jgi:HemY protein
MPLAALPSDKAVVVEPEPAREPLLAPPPATDAASAEIADDGTAQAQDTAAIMIDEVEEARAPDPAVAAPAAAPPLFRARQEAVRNSAAAIPPVIPIVRAPDDPGVDDESDRDEFDGSGGPTAQAGGWRGFVARWVG